MPERTAIDVAMMKVHLARLRALVRRRARSAD
jgi:hypothetical protein